MRRGRVDPSRKAPAIGDRRSRATRSAIRRKQSGRKIPTVATIAARRAEQITNKLPSRRPGRRELADRDRVESWLRVSHQSIDEIRLQEGDQN